ncbi:MAG: plasmid recombination protein [Firmicutes bacterium]|nr:plasmid recombination protein [Bacillota bacterium]
MQYNFHNEKYKMSDVGGIKREQFREYSKDTEYRNKVDPERTGNNLYLEMVPGGKDWFGQISEAQDRTKETTGRAVRKDAVVLCSTVESVPESWSPDVCRTYFQDKAEWFGGYLHERAGVDEDALKTVAVHLDESTPHATYAWIPIKDDKLQAKNILNREFLRDLQKDSQDFTFSWIDRWNEEHPSEMIEKMDPYTPDSRQQHLTESEYREKKIDEKMQLAEQKMSDAEEKELAVSEREKTLDEQRREFSEAVSEASEQIDAAWEKIGDLQDEKDALEESTRQAVEAKEHYDTQAAAYEEKVIELTEAPDLPSYESVLTENAELKEELSLKDRLIDSLREEIDVWKDRFEELKESVNEWREKVEDWKDRFHDFAEEAGQKIMGYFGYETEDQDISEYPSKEFAEAYDSMKEDVSGIDPKSLRTIPDNEEEGKYRVVQRTDDGYETVKGGFDTRFEAESWQKDLASGVRNLDDTFEEDRSLHR